MANSRSSDATIEAIDNQLSSAKRTNSSGAKRLSTDPRYRQACQFCRDAKLRCNHTSDDPKAPCRRCANAGRHCEVVQREARPSKRLKTAEQVEKLQNQVALLTAMVHGSQSNRTAQNASAYPGAEDERLLDDTRIIDEPFTPLSENSVSPASKTDQSNLNSFANKPVVPSNRNETVGSHADSRNRSFLLPASFDHTLYFLGVTNNADNQELESCMKSTTSDVVDRKIVSPSSAAASFNNYVNDMAPLLPVVVFPPGTTASDIRRTKPTLFLSILSITSKPETRHTLKKELRQIFADLITRDGEKSVELVQALFIWAAWYTPEEDAKRINFHHFLLTATFMIMDIVAERESKDMIHVRYDSSSCYAENEDCPPSHEILSIKRAWLGCYIGCSVVAIASGRPSPFPWNSYTTYFIESLEALPETSQLDKKLCLLAQQQLIADDCRQQFSVGNLTDNFNLSNKATQATLRVFEGRVDLWYRKIPIEMASPLLEIHMHLLNLYIHETAIRFNDFSSLFNSPLTKSLLEDVTFEAKDFTPERINGIFACLKAAHAVLKLFCSQSTLDIRNIPDVYFVRALYCVCILARLSKIFSVVNIKVGKTFEEGDLVLAESLGNLVTTLDAAAQDRRCPVAAVISRATKKVWSLCKDHTASNFSTTDISNIRSSEYSAASQNDSASALRVDSVDGSEANRPFGTSTTIAPDRYHPGGHTALSSTGALLMQNLEQPSINQQISAGDGTSDRYNWPYFNEDAPMANGRSDAIPSGNFHADPIAYNYPMGNTSEMFSGGLYDYLLFPSVWENGT